MARDDARTTITLPDQIMEDLKKSAHKNERSLTAETKIAIEQYLYGSPDPGTVSNKEIENKVLESLDNKEFRDRFISKLRDYLESE